VFDNVRFGATDGMAKAFNCAYSVHDGSSMIIRTNFIDPSTDISNRYYDYRYAVPRMKHPTDLD